MYAFLNENGVVWMGPEDKTRVLSFQACDWIWTHEIFKIDIIMLFEVTYESWANFISKLMLIYEYINYRLLKIPTSSAVLACRSLLSNGDNIIFEIVVYHHNPT